MRYPGLLARVHARLAERFDLRTHADMNRTFGGSVPEWPAFADTADALRALSKHFNLVILSNVDRDGFEASNRKLGVTFDAIYTAEDVGSYKPALRNFEHMVESLQSELGAPRRQILHTAQSLFHDHVPASKMGLARTWIDRQGLAQGGDWGATVRVEHRPHVDFRFTTLGTMAERVLAEC